jgi:hypothetical protein
MLRVAFAPEGIMGSAPAPTGDPAGAPSDPPAAAARPDYIPEPYWDGEKGAPKVDAMLADINGFGSKIEAERKAAIEAFQAERRKGLPETPDAYGFEPPKGMVPDDLVILTEAPGADWKPEDGKTHFLFDPKDPLAAWWRDACHRAGMSAEEYQQGIVQFAKTLGTRAPTPQERAAEAEAVYKEIGPDGRERVGRAYGQVKALLGEEGAKAIDSAITSAAGFKAIEALLAKVNAPRFAAPTGGSPTPAITEKDLMEKKAKAMDLPPGDPDRRRMLEEVTAGFKALYPSRAA